MATKKADADADSDGAAQFSMEDLRARLDAPLFHRDPGLSTPAQLPRLRELTIDHAVETPEPVTVAAPAPAAQPAPAAERPKLMSFSDLMSAAAPAPVKEPTPQPVAQPVETVVPVPSGVNALGPTETQALLEVLATFEASANRLNELNGRTSDQVDAIEPIVEEPVVVAAPEPVVQTVVEAVPEPVVSAIEAELNRLAFLPDHEEPVGPVVVPVITHTEQHPAMAVPAMAVPVLSQHEIYNPRPIAAPVGRRNLLETSFEPVVQRRRSGKGVVRRLFSLVVALALLGGGLYAAKYYLLDPKWDSEVKPLVEEVETARGLEFDHAVDVTTVSGDDYALKIASYALDVNSGNQDSIAGELRALGLLSGAFDLRTIGLAALPETPAFYDFRAEQIYVVSGLPLETYRFAMHRALTAALLDQEYGWGGRIGDAAPAVVRGTRALYEADALATASSMLPAAERALLVEQRPGLFQTFGVVGTPSPFVSTVAGRLGLSLRAFIESIPVGERAAVLSNAMITDGQALDLRRLVSGVADGAVSQEGTRPQGMLFWYHVLASRLDPATSWNNALPIESDDVVVTSGATGYCVSARLTVSPAALDGVGAAFVAWAASAPVESATTVTPSLVDGNAFIIISACDPGVAVQTNNGVQPLTMGGAPLRSEQYRLLLLAQPTLPRAQAACAVYGGDTVSITDERLLVDGIEGWSVPAAHPAPDPGRADCVPA